MNIKDEGIPSEDISFRASEKIKEIKKAQAELTEIQNLCKHDKTDIQNISPSGSSFSLRKICTECEKIIAYPTREETLKWLG